MATNAMDENQIAMAEASILLGWRPFDRGESVKLEREKVELAISRARAANRDDYEKVLEEVMLAILFQVGRIVRETVDRPVLGALTTVEVEEGGEVCGVCQEDMAKGIEAYAMECKHKFHQDCIFSWLKIKDTCPLCRYQMKFEGYVF